MDYTEISNSIRMMIKAQGVDDKYIDKEETLYYDESGNIKHLIVNGENGAFPPTRDVSVSAMLVSMRQKNIAQVSILERYFFVSTYQAAGPDTCLAVFVVASLPPCL